MGLIITFGVLLLPLSLSLPHDIKPIDKKHTSDSISVVRDLFMFSPELLLFFTSTGSVVCDFPAHLSLANEWTLAKLLWVGLVS